MVLFTMVARSSDGLILSASTDLDNHERIADSKKNGKALARKARSLSSKVSVESGEFVWHIMQTMGVSFMALTEIDYPSVLAFCFLDELQHEFDLSYDEHSVQQARRPYCFVDFNSFMQKCKQRYVNPQSLHTRIPVTEMSRRLDEAPPARMSAVSILGSAAAVSSASGTSSYSSHDGGSQDNKSSTIAVKLLVVAFSMLLLLAAGYRYHLVLEVYDISSLESSEVPVSDIIWSTLSFCVGTFCLIQLYMLVVVPRWANPRQHWVLVPLTLCLAALCCFGDWIYVLVNMCNASMSIGIAELTRSRSTRPRILKQSA